MHFVNLRWPNSLSAKVLLAFVAGTVLSIVMVALAATALVNTQEDVLVEMAVAERATDLASKLRFDGSGFPIGFDDPIKGALDESDESWHEHSLKTEVAYRVLDGAGHVVLSSAAGTQVWLQVGARLESRFRFEHSGVAMRGATASIENNGTIWHVQIATSTRFLHLIYRDFALPFAGIGILLFALVLFLVFGICAYVTLGYTLKPLREISDSAARISPQTLHARLLTKQVPDEIAPLVGSFNRMLDRIEHGFRVQRDFLANAAHELKTPLALIRGQVELGVDESNREELLRDVTQMGRLIQQLLHLAEASEPQNYRFESVGAEGLVFEVMDYLERLASKKRVRVHALVEPGLVLLRTDRGALFTLLKNLVENAIQHSRDGDVVQIDARTGSISVQDQGPGVPPEDIAKLFTRFWRSADRRDLGSGLGLSICREIATVHGWELQLERRDVGMVFSLILSTMRHNARVVEVSARDGGRSQSHLYRCDQQ
jgi:signal transduction histidine kinase